MKPDIKLYYVIPVVFFIILLILILLLPKKNTNQTTIYTTPIVLPTTFSTQKNTNTSSLSSSSIAPVYTGAENEKLPQEVADLAAQKNTLRKKTPLNQPTFVITFDYATDKFIVSLNDPKTTSRTNFEEWLKANYSAIPLDRFTFK